jgi:hypothetical protein
MRSMKVVSTGPLMFSVTTENVVVSWAALIAAWHPLGHVLHSTPAMGGNRPAVLALHVFGQLQLVLQFWQHGTQLQLHPGGRRPQRVVPATTGLIGPQLGHPSRAEKLVPVTIGTA